MKFLKIFFTIFIFSFFYQKSYSEIEIDVKTLILQDHHSGEILFEKEADITIYPASMTKIMTAIVTFDLLKKGETSLDELITVSEKAWRMSQSGYSSMFIMLNDQVSVEDLLKGIIVISGNDACVALAEGLSGTEKDFVVLMNELIKKTNIKNISVKKINNNKYRLLVGPFENFNALKTTYISLNNLGFESLIVYKE